MSQQSPDKKELRNTISSLLNEGKTVRIEAFGYSMYPEIKPGYTINIEPVKTKDDLRPGDIIAWYRDKDLVCHRLLYIFESDNESYCLTRGDSSPASDAPVKFEQLAGKVSLIQNKKKTMIPIPLIYIPEWKYSFNRKLVWIVAHYRKWVLNK